MEAGMFRVRREERVGKHFQTYEVGGRLPVVVFVEILELGH